MRADPMRNLGGHRVALRRRRPSGEPAPLPRHPLEGSGKFWLPLALVLVLIIVLLLSSTTFVLGRGTFWDNVDQVLVDRVNEVRTGALTVPARWLNVFTNVWVLRMLRLAVVAVLLFYRRWRQLIAFIGLIMLAQPVLFVLTNRLARPRPDGIEILAPWSGFAAPSIPIAALILTLVGMAFVLVPKGRTRSIVFVAVGLLVVAVGAARLYLGVERMTDIVSAAILAVAAVLLVFRVWVPDDLFPVTYSRHKSAHLDLTETRRRAILVALRDQLGLPAEDVRLFALEASAGSSPLLITLDGDDPPHVFAKLYARNHVRSDRWYKLGRSLLYGALEDERPFSSVRALAEREDYIMRLFADAGVPGPSSYGVVEITPGREYLVVTDFIEAEEISKAPVDAGVVDEGLRAVRSMWDAGLAHRDIKPGNVLVASGHLYLIDAAFGETRPSAWREAVDLANMMLTLSLYVPTDEVYEAATKYFTDDEISEALAATRGVTIPSQLSRAVHRDPRDLLDELRSKVPERPPIRIQRWTRRRLALLALAGTIAVFALWLGVVNLQLVGNLL